MNTVREATVRVMPPATEAVRTSLLQSINEVAV